MPRKAMDAKRGTTTGGEVDAFLAALDHPFTAGIGEMRRLVLAADAGIDEGIKWNAPSFRTTEWFATTHLRAKNGFGLILHFGAKKNAISDTGVAIPDPGSLLEWLGRDRAMLMFSDMQDLLAKQDGLKALVREWVRHV